MISGFPLQAALGALLLSPEELEKMVFGSDDGSVPDKTEDMGKPSNEFQFCSMSFQY